MTQNETKKKMKKRKKRPPCWLSEGDRKLVRFGKTFRVAFAIFFVFVNFDIDQGQEKGKKILSNIANSEKSKQHLLVIIKRTIEGRRYQVIDEARSMKIIFEFYVA